MSHLPFPQEQLQFIIDLAHHRVDWLDPFFRFLNYFDTPYFFFGLIPMIWLGYSYRWGMRIFYWITLSTLVNSLAKNLVGWPRPSQDLFEIGMFHFSSFGFPSGAAQTCLFLGSILLYYWRNAFAWTIGIIYILLISFSRLYLGVHYPIDILGGWILGLIFLLVFLYTKDPIEKFLNRKGALFSLILALVISSVVLMLAPKQSYMMGAVMGISLGTYFSLKGHLFLPDSKTIKEGVFRSLMGIACLFLILLLWPKEFPIFTQSFGAGLAMSWAASPLYRLFGKSVR